MGGKVGDKVIALSKEKQSVLEKTVKSIKKVKQEKEQEKSSDTRGIIMINHLPHGFFEEEIREYFSQFGRVLRIRVARSEKTGNIKGYAFVEFQYQEVAKIAAETMNNYLMFDRLVKCQLLPQKNTAESGKIFAANRVSKTSYPKLKNRDRVKLIQMEKHPENEEEGFLSFRLNRLERANKRLADIGINYEFDVNNQKTTVPAFPKRKRKAMKNKNDTQENTAQPEKSAENVRLSRKRVSQLEEKNISPKTPKMSINNKTEEDQQPLVQKSVTKSPRFSPKMLNDRKSEGEHPSKQALKTPKKTSGSDETLEQTTQAKSPRFSPKMLSDRKSEGEHPMKQTTGMKTPKKSKGRKSDQSLEPTVQAKSPRFSLKMLSDRKSEGEHPMKQNAAMKTPKKSKGRKRESEQLSDEQTLETKSPRFSPKMLSDRKSEGEHPMKQADTKKTPKYPKFSPKILRSRKSEVLQKPDDIVKTPKLPTVSPKLLRSRKSEGSQLKTQEDNSKTIKAAEKSLTKPVRGRKSEILQGEKQVVTKTPEKSKFSPKMLRSRKSEGPSTPNNVARLSVSVAKTPSAKVSPKLTKRGRKSVM